MHEIPVSHIGFLSNIASIKNILKERAVIVLLVLKNSPIIFALSAANATFATFSSIYYLQNDSAVISLHRHNEDSKKARC